MRLVLVLPVLIALAGCEADLGAAYRTHREVLKPMQARLAATAKALVDPPREPGPAPALVPRPETSPDGYNAAWLHATTAGDPDRWEHQLEGAALYMGSGLELESVMRGAASDGAAFEGIQDSFQAAGLEAVAGLRYVFLYRYLSYRAPGDKEDHAGEVATWLVDLGSGAVADSLRVTVGSGYSEAQSQLRQAWEKRLGTRLLALAHPAQASHGDDKRSQERLLIFGTCFLMIVGPLVLLKLANLHMVAQVREFARPHGLEIDENRWWGLAHHPSARGAIGGRQVAYRSWTTGSQGKGAVGLVEVSAALPADRTFTMTRVPILFEGRAIRDALAAPTIGDDAFKAFFSGAEPVLPLLCDAARRAFVEHGLGDLVAGQAGLAFRFPQTLMSSAANRALFTRMLDQLLALAPRLEAGS